MADVCFEVKCDTKRDTSNTCMYYMYSNIEQAAP